MMKNIWMIQYNFHLLPLKNLWASYFLLFHKFLFLLEESTAISQMMESIGAEGEKQNQEGIKLAHKNNQPSSTPKMESTKPRSFDTHLLDSPPEPPPGLEQETILEAGHRQTLAKLRFVLELIETIMFVADNKTNPIAIAIESGKRKSVNSNF